MYNFNQQFLSRKDEDQNLSFCEKLLLYPALAYLVFEMLPQVIAFFVCGGAR